MINDKYYKWLVHFISHESELDYFGKLLRKLYDTEYMYVFAKDRNRAEDGLLMRRRFMDEMHQSVPPRYALDKKCSILEMMVALALRCEESIMDDSRYGNRTSQWFWEMISSLGLNGMTDERYDDDMADRILYRFMSHDYGRDGKGGLFWVRRSESDMRTLEIWDQMCLYLDTLI